MHVLALDTTTRAGSIALVSSSDGGNAPGALRIGDPTRSHAERLPSDIFALLDAQKLRMDDIDLFAVASGPGSFTGLRIGIATMQGLSLVRQRPMVGVSALVALAHMGGRDLAAGTRVGAWMDAYRRDVFAALFEVTGEPAFHPERLIEREGATVDRPLNILERWKGLGLPAVMIGDGAVEYAELVAAVASGVPGVDVQAAPPLAGAIGLLAIEYARRGETVTPAGIQPLYVRRPDAEVARDHALANRRPDVS
jgi:tRNA threonylcarbamoyladenosine biosynthesis protein TsaB